MATFIIVNIIVILAYTILFIRSKKIGQIDYYATSLTLSVWILLAYIFYADHWWLYVLLLLVVGVATYGLSFVMALKNAEVSKFSDYFFNAAKTGNRKLETILFVFYFPVFPPLIERLDKTSIWSYLLPVGYFTVERILFYIFRWKGWFAVSAK